MSVNKIFIFVCVRQFHWYIFLVVYLFFIPSSVDLFWKLPHKKSIHVVCKFKCSDRNLQIIYQHILTLKQKWGHRLFFHTFSRNTMLKRILDKLQGSGLQELDDNSPVRCVFSGLVSEPAHQVEEEERLWAQLHTDQPLGAGRRGLGEWGGGRGVQQASRPRLWRR